jgi:hypothetical protein
MVKAGLFRREIRIVMKEDMSEFDSRDQLWQCAFETYYDSYYEEIAAEDLINRYQNIDEVSKVIVVLATAGIAVSVGFDLWNQPFIKVIWTILAGIGAILAMVNMALGIPSRLHDWGEHKRCFATLRNDLATFRYRMKIDPFFSIEEYTKEFVEYRKRYSEGYQRQKADILYRRRLQDKAQDKLNLMLGEEIIQDKEVN